MDRREFVNKSLYATASVAALPVLTLKYSSIDAVKRFHSFAETKPWKFEAATKFIESLGDQCCEVLRAVIADGDSAACCLAVCIVRQMGASALPLLPELVRLAEDEDHADSDRAVITLGKLGPAADLAVPVLEDRLNHSDLRIRLDAANSLIEIQPHRLDEWATVLHVALDDLRTAYRACSMVGDSRNAGSRFVPQLESLVAATSLDVRPDIHCEAARAIFRITGDTELKAVQRALRTEQHLLASPDDRVRNLMAYRPICGPALQRLTH